MPRSVVEPVWYVEARPQAWPQRQPQCGSAVAVWLRRRERPDTARKFLLTCAHVILADGSGAPLGEILCWRPGSGYTSPNKIPQRLTGECPGAWSARIAEFMAPLGPLPGARPPGDDWVLLDVADPEFQQHRPAAVRPAAVRSAPAVDGTIEIVGYPGGASDFRHDNVVRAAALGGFREREHAEPGALKWRGRQATGPGMSGGGCFADGALVGIHLGQEPTTLSIVAVDLEEIRLRLANLDWEFVPWSKPPPPPSWLATLAVLAFVGAAASYGLGAASRPEPRDLLVCLAVESTADIAADRLKYSLAGRPGEPAALAPGECLALTTGDGLSHDVFAALVRRSAYSRFLDTTTLPRPVRVDDLPSDPGVHCHDTAHGARVCPPDRPPHRCAPVTDIPDTKGAHLCVLTLDDCCSEA
jgi:hypothetical protein